jgi:GT2 family glycosyltransferase
MTRRMTAMTVVVASRNRKHQLCHTLERLVALPEDPEIVVVDNASEDGTGAEVARRFPTIRLLRLPVNIAGAARTDGARTATTPYVAFSDDDSWWEPGALAQATQLFDSYPRLGLIAARTLVEPQGELDPVSAAMARSPLPEEPDLPGRPVLGFLACSAVVRRDAFLAAGGFSRLLLIGGEEELLAYDLATMGWGIVYVPEVVAHHQPSPVRDNLWRQALQRRNRVLVDWLRRPVARAIGSTRRLAADARHDQVARAALRSTLLHLPQALAGRHRIPSSVERAALVVEGKSTYPR